MRYCYITEEQLDFLLREGDCYLDKTDLGTDAPKDSIKYNSSEVAVNPADSDNVLTTDKVANSRVAGHPWLRRTHGMNEELDDEKACIGKNSQEYLSQMNGKMANNISKEVTKGGSRLNTTEVRLNRLKQQKKDDPITFMQNGGEKTIKALQAIKNRQRNAAKSTNPLSPRYNTSLSADFNNGIQSPKSNNGVIYDFRED